MTNYEMIIQMSIEEMHEFLIKLSTRRLIGKLPLDLPETPGLSYNDEILVWLKTPADVSAYAYALPHYSFGRKNEENKPRAIGESESTACQD